MHFQKTKINIHSLQQCRDTPIKNRAHLHMANLGLILYEVSVLLLFRYAYTMTNLVITPRGSETRLNKYQVECVPFRSNLPRLTVQHDGHSGEIDLTDSFGLIVIYSNTCSIKRVENATKCEMTLCANVLDPQSTGIVDPKRSGDGLFIKWMFGA